MSEDLRPAPATANAGEIQIDLMSTFVRLVRGYRTMLLFAVLGAAAGIAISLSLAKTYTAQAIFLPPQSPDSLQAASFIMRDDPADLYIGMLASRSVADSVIERANLLAVYKTTSPMRARRALAGASKFEVDKNNLIMINITTGDPKLSATIANAYLEALYEVNGEMIASASLHRRQFFEAQMETEKAALGDAEVELKNLQEKTGTVLPQGEAEAGLSATARLQSEIEDGESHLSSLLTYSTDQNPQVVRLRAQINALRAELAQQQSSNAKGAGIPSNGNMPTVLLDYMRKERDLKERTTLYDELTQQFEKARLASIDPGPQLEVIDRAVVPETKSGPPRTLIVLVSTLTSLLLGLFKVALTLPLKRFLRKYSQVAAQV